MPTLGWERAYRSGDRVRYDPEGLVFLGRADDQVKVGGRRIELGEIDNALQALPGVTAGAAAVRAARSGTVLVGYVAVPETFDRAAAVQPLRASCPPRSSPGWPWSTSCRPGPRARSTGMRCPGRWRPWQADTAAQTAPGAARRVARRSSGRRCWGPRPARTTTSSTSAAGACRPRSWSRGCASATRRHGRRRLRPPAVRHDGGPPGHARRREQAATAGRSGAGAAATQAGPVVALGRAAHHLGAALADVDRRRGSNLVASASRSPGSRPCAGGGCCWAGRADPGPGRMLLSAALVRGVLAVSSPATTRAVGRCTLRVWLAERHRRRAGALDLAGAPWMRYYAAAARCADRPGRRPAHASRRSPGSRRSATDAPIEPEVDLTGHWIDGDVLHVGAITVGADARVGAPVDAAARAVVGDGAEIAAGSAVSGDVPGGRVLVRVTGERRGARPAGRPPKTRPRQPQGLAGRLRGDGAAVSLVPVAGDCGGAGGAPAAARESGAHAGRRDARGPA